MKGGIPEQGVPNGMDFAPTMSRPTLMWSGIGTAGGQRPPLRKWFMTGRRMGFPTAPKGSKIKVLFGSFSFKKKNQDFFFSLVLLPFSSTR